MAESILLAQCIDIGGLMKHSRLTMTDDELAARPPTTWGPWRYERGGPHLVLTMNNDDDWYDVDLRRCTCSGAVLDWIIQISEKMWATPEVIASLVNALDDLLRPQETMCSFGSESTVPDKDMAALLRKNEVLTIRYREWDAGQADALEQAA